MEREQNLTNQSCAQGFPECKGEEDGYEYADPSCILPLRREYTGAFCV